MAMVKGYCTNCNKNNEERRIFDVNSEAKFCYCPHCGKKYRPKVAIANYEKTIDKYNKKAKYFLKNVGEALYAYNLFGYVLELEYTNRTARLGRLLSLSFLSTLRRNRFNEVKELLDMEKSSERGMKSKKKYSAFLMSLDGSTRAYISLVKRNLTFRGYFYDTDCIKLYFCHIRDAINLKRAIAAELSSINDAAGASDVFNNIKEMELEYNKTIFTVDGNDHYFANFTKAGEPLLTNGSKHIDTKMGKFRLSTLDKNNKKLNVLKERVFTKAFPRMYHAEQRCVPAAITAGVLSIGLLVTFFIMMGQPIASLFLTLFIVLFVLSLSLVAMKFILISILKKPRF